MAACLSALLLVRNYTRGLGGRAYSLLQTWLYDMPSCELCLWGPNPTILPTWHLLAHARTLKLPLHPLPTHAHMHAVAHVHRGVPFVWLLDILLRPALDKYVVIVYQVYWYVRVLCLYSSMTKSFCHFCHFVTFGGLTFEVDFLHSTQQVAMLGAMARNTYRALHAQSALPVQLPSTYDTTQPPML